MALRRWMTVLAVAGALALPLAACGGDDADAPEAGSAVGLGQDAAPAEVGAGAPMPADVDAEESAPMAAVADAVEEAGAEGGADAPAVAPAEVKVKTALEASDPATFRLASGSPQLVEFFAFW